MSSATPPVRSVGKADAAALKHQSDALDEALKESFPASDPIAVSIDPVPEGALPAGKP
ncbi:hypothetical protein AAKU55_003385 [Oxalobacteraceae bacterium GrIS 1.11]